MDVLELMNQHHLIAIDAVMGSGKTTSMIQFAIQHPEFHYMFVTPYLDEVDRIIDGTGEEFFQPFDYGKGKLTELHEMLQNHQNVATTHALLQLSRTETLDLIRDGQYVLILDEAVGCVQEFNAVANKPITSEDFIKMLLDKGIIEVFYEYRHPQCGLITWVGGDAEGTAYEDVARMASEQRLYCIGYEPGRTDNNVVLMCEYPVQIFYAFKNVFYMSYLHRRSIMDGYFTLNRIESHLLSADMTEDGQATLCEYGKTRLQPRMYADLIDIHFDYKPSGKQLNKLGEKDYSLSFNDYAGMTENRRKKLCEHLTYYFRYICQARSAEVMYTVPKDCVIPDNTEAGAVLIQPDGFTYIKKRDQFRSEIREFNQQLESWHKERRTLLIYRDKSILDGQGEKRLLELQKLCRKKPLDEKDYMTFVVNNAKATNKLVLRKKLAYCLNKFLQPSIITLFRNRGFDIDEDQWALSEMIQWIWRSAIRKGLPIQIYIPSKRMRNLLLDWLGVDENFYRVKHGFQPKRLRKKKQSDDLTQPKRGRGRPKKITTNTSNDGGIVCVTHSL